MHSRMNVRSGRNLPYIRWSVVFKKSRSRGSSPSNRSRSCGGRVPRVTDAGFSTLAAAAVHARWAGATQGGGTYLAHKAVVDVPHGNVGVKVGRLEEAKEQLVHNLQVRPSRFLGGTTPRPQPARGHGNACERAAGGGLAPAAGLASTHQNRFVFLGVERVAKRIELRRHRAEKVVRKLRRAPGPAHTHSTVSREHARWMRWRPRRPVAGRTMRTMAG